MNEYLNPYFTGIGRWLRGNLHTHTCCGRYMDISVSAPMYASLGYDFLAVTDHNRAPSQDQWQRWQDQTPLILIPGEENGHTDHIVELGVYQVTPTPSAKYIDRARALRKGDGFVFAAHPQEYEHGPESIRKSANELHAFELFNGLREARGCNEPANTVLWDEILTEGKKIWGVAVDDFHCEYISPGHGWVWVQIPDNTTAVNWRTIVRQLKSGAFYASTYPKFESISMVDNLLLVSADRHTQRLRIVGPKGYTLYWTSGTQLKWRVESDLRYFRIEAESGIKRAWSQPFYHL